MKNIFYEIKSKHMGVDAIIGKTVRIRCPKRFRIGRNSIIDDFTYISCRLHIGSFTHIGSGTHIIGGREGKVTIGNFVNIAPGCNIASGQNDYRGGDLVGPAIPERCGGKAELAPVVIGDHCLFGFNVSVLPGVKLPEGVAIGAHSLVKPMKYKPWTLYADCPKLKEIGPRDNTLIKKREKKILEYVRSRLI